MAALWGSLLEVYALHFSPFAVCWICWVEVRGSQCHVSENISWLHSLPLLVCWEISSVAWLGSQGSARVGVKAQGAVTQNCIFHEITCTTASSLRKRPAQQGDITGTEKNINSKFLLQQSLQLKGKQLDSNNLFRGCCIISYVPCTPVCLQTCDFEKEMWAFICQQFKLNGAHPTSSGTGRVLCLVFPSTYNPPSSVPNFWSEILPKVSN